MPKKNPKKILFFISHPTLGGSQQYILDLVIHLNRQKYEPLVVSCFTGPFLKILQKNQIPTFVLPMKKKYMKIKENVCLFNPFSCLPFFFNLLYVMISFYFLIKREKIDLVYNNNLRCQLLSWLGVKLSKIPTCWHLHAFTKTDLFYQVASRSASQIIVLSKDVKRRLGKVIGKNKEKIKVIYNGVNLEKVKEGKEGAEKNRQKMKEKWGIKENDLVVGMIGQLVHGKGWEYFVKMAGEVKKQISQSKFLIVGNEPFYSEEGYKNKLQRLIRELKLEGEVVFTEYQKDIFRIFSILNIFTLTSLYEPFGRVIIEAMASYVPVIAFSTGGVPEIIIHGQTGILVEVGNYKQMAQEVVSLARNGERRKRIAALAYERVKSAFTLERTIKEIEKLFCEAVKKNSWIIVSIFSILGIPLLS